MIIFWIILIIFLSLIFHFKPRIKKGYIWYNYYGRRDKTRKRINMKKFIDRVFTFFAFLIFAIASIYTCGFFVFYAGYRDQDEDTMIVGAILSAINGIIIYLTLKFIPL